MPVSLKNLPSVTSYDPSSPLTHAAVVNIKSRIKNGNANKKDLNLVIADIRQHLASSPIATISNYNGLFGNSVISNLIQNYPHVLSDDDVLASQFLKSKVVMEHILEMFLHNKRIFIPPNYINLLLDFFQAGYNQDKNLALQPQFVVVGYEDAKSGYTPQPLPKSSS